MKKITIISSLLSIILISNCCLSYADQVKLFGIENIYNNLFSTKNPFEPQLPKKAVIQKDVPEGPSVVDRLKGLLDSSAPIFDQEEAEQSLSRYHISGLIWKSDHPQAIINRKIFNIGDMLNDMEIVAIKKTGVDVKIEGHVLTISSK